MKPSASVTSDSEMPPTPACRMRAATSSVPSFSSEPENGFERTLHVGLDDQREFLAARGLELRHHLLERAAHAGNRGSGVLALLVGAVARDLAGAGFVFDHGQTVAGFRRSVEAEHFDRHRGAGFVDGDALVVDQRADAAHFGAGDDDVADPQRAALHQHGRDRAAAAIELGFDHGAFGGTFGIGLEVEQFGLQRDHFQQPVEIGLVLGGDLDVDDVAAERFDLDFVLQQFGAHAFRLGVGLVDLVDRHDHRNLGGLGVIDRLDRLRHHAVIGRDHQDHDVGHLGAAGAHRGERGVARRVDEGDLLAAFRRGHLIGADMLGDAAGFAGHHVGMAQRVEQRGLAVVDMAHHGHDGRTRLGVGGIVDGVEQAFLDVGRGDALDGVAEFLGDQLRGIGIDHVGDLVHRALLHQQPDDVDRALGHAVGEFLDVDGFRDDDFADQLFLRLVRRMALQALGAAAERGDRALAHVVGVERGDQRQAAALLLRRGLCGGLGRLRGTGDAAGATADLARTFILVAGVGGNAGRARRRAARCGARGGRRGAGLGLAKRFLASSSALRLASSSWRWRSSSALRRASAASRSACSMPSLLLRRLASSSASRRSSSSRTLASASALARAERSSSVSVRSTTPELLRGAARRRRRDGRQRRLGAGAAFATTGSGALRRFVAGPRRRCGACRAFPPQPAWCGHG